jgi:hypothetical protein
MYIYLKHVTIVWLGVGILTGLHCNFRESESTGDVALLAGISALIGRPLQWLVPGIAIDLDGDGASDGITIDLDGDGRADGVDTDANGVVDIVYVDANSDGVPDGLDLNHDGSADVHLCLDAGSLVLATAAGCDGNPVRIIDSDADGIADGVDTDGDGGIDLFFTNAPASSATAGPLRIFVTATLYRGNLGGFAGADAKCASDANRPATGTYRAHLEGNGAIQAARQYVRTDGVTLIGTADGAGALPTTLTNSVQPAYEDVWTGAGGNNCSNWTNESSGTGDAGVANLVSSGYWNSVSNSCIALSGKLALYCAEQ